MHKCSLDASVHLVKLPRMALPTMMCQDICPYLCAFSSGPCLNWWWWWWGPSSVVQQARDKCPLSHRRPHCYNHPCDGGHFVPARSCCPGLSHFPLFRGFCVALCLFHPLRRPLTFSICFVSPLFFGDALFPRTHSERPPTHSPQEVWGEAISPNSGPHFEVKLS